MKTNTRIEFGDFQTPPLLAEEICRVVRARCGDFAAVIETTCGHGAFLAAAGAVFPRAGLCGREINPAYVEIARVALSDAGFDGRADVGVQDFFSADWNAELSAFPDRLLLLGNPPWVTNAGVSAIGGSNLPVKANFQGMRGLEARTGKANFDISEWMLIRLVEAIRPRASVLAMLCKTATARKFLRYAWRHAATAELRGAAGDPGAFAWRFDLAALQRNVKALGTFGNQAHNRGKRIYLRFIPPTVAHLRGNFERNPPMRALAGRLLPILSALAEKAAAESPA